MQQCDPLAMNRRAGIDTDPGDVAARPRQTLGKTLRDRIGREGHDWELRIRLFENRRTRSDEEDDIRVAADDAGRQRLGTGPVLLAAISFDREILSLDMPEPAQLLEQGPVVPVVALFVHQGRRLGRTEDREPLADPGRLCRST
jgi:hypothetical protein